MDTVGGGGASSRDWTEETDELHRKRHDQIMHKTEPGFEILNIFYDGNKILLIVLNWNKKPN